MSRPRGWVGVAAFVIVAAIAALFVNAALVNADTRAAIARDGGTVITTDVVPANVLIEGEGPAIVLIHGFGAALDWWDAVAPDLARDHRVIRLDLIGHGGTEAPERGYSIERQAALVAALLDAQQVQRFTVIGHSMGGEVATALAEARPDRVAGVVLIDTPPTAAVDFNTVTQFYMSPVIGPLLSRFVTASTRRRALPQAFTPGFAVPEAFVADLAQLTYTAAVGAHDESVAFRDAQPLDQRLAALQPIPPLQAIFGNRDAIVPATEAKRYETVPGASVTIIDGVGHSPMVEAPEKTLALIRAFLKRTIADATHQPS